MGDKRGSGLSLKPGEKRAIVVLASIFSLRLLGLFLLLPVLALYAASLPAATPAQIGLAVGAYGITQAALQIPFGWLSDRLGRRPVIFFGLLVFIAGSIFSALADTTLQLVLGRAIQGAGAISAAVTALLADHTRAEIRTRAMALLGISIGMSFLLSLVLGPLLTAVIGVPGLFWLGSAMGALAIVLLWLGLPESPAPPAPTGLGKGLGAVLREPALLRLYSGVLFLHLMITALFVAVPFALRDLGGMGSETHWKVYLPVLLVSLTGTIPLILLSERPAWQARSVPLAVTLLLIAQLLLGFRHGTIMMVAISLVVFFAAFNFLEARLPSAVSHEAPAEYRGAAMGAFASSQFFGAFLGGSLGGLVMGRAGLAGVFLLTACAAVLWLVLHLALGGARDRPDARAAPGA